MTTELVLTEALEQRGLHLEQTYYRSRIFTAESGMNELVISAQPVLALITHILQCKTKPDFNQFNDNLLHELKTYESRATLYHYDAETLLLGRYYLAAALEEAIRTHDWFDAWQEAQLLEHMLPINHSPEHAKGVLERVYQQFYEHIDLLELIYLCVSLTEITPEQQATLDNLYQRIKHQRGPKNPNFFLQEHSSKIVGALPREKTSWLMFGICGFLIISLYTGFAFWINHSIPTTSIEKHENL